ncbi:hypothetical protein F4802DRAFT_257812 [Xylaria palmicola]|nr:hypothetical protein F4802DRAFT_257812 [Xylaria palmicola]
MPGREGIPRAHRAQRAQSDYLVGIPTAIGVPLGHYKARASTLSLAVSPLPNPIPNWAAWLAQSTQVSGKWIFFFFTRTPASFTTLLSPLSPLATCLCATSLSSTCSPSPTSISPIANCQFQPAAHVGTDGASPPSRAVFSFNRARASSFACPHSALCLRRTRCFATHWGRPRLPPAHQRPRRAIASTAAWIDSAYSELPAPRKRG